MARIPTGIVIWEFETGRAVRSSPAVSSDGTLYFWSSNNNLYAIKTNSPSQHEGLEFDSPWLHHSFHPLFLRNILKNRWWQFAPRPGGG
jgi:hypothetical protein